MSFIEASKMVFHNFHLGDILLKTGLYLGAVVICLQHVFPGRGHPSSPDSRLFKDVSVNTDTGWFSPHGCTLQMYQQSSTKDCLKNVTEGHGQTHLLFVGDSSIKALFTTMATLVSPGYTPPKDTPGASLQDKKLAVHLEYRWAANLRGVLQQYQELAKHKETAPNMVIQGTGLMSEKINGKLDQAPVTANWTLLLPYINDICTKSFCLWMPPDPKDRPTSEDAEQLQLPKEEQQYTLTAKGFVETTKMMPWMSSSAIMSYLGNDATRGAYLKSQLVWNWRCNDHFQGGTCFTLRTEQHSPLPVVSLVAVVLFVLYECASAYIRQCHLSSITDEVQVKRLGHMLDFIGSVIKLGLVMAYFHLCDREDASGILKESKHYSNPKFFVPLFLLLAGGYITLRKSDDVTVLNRYQTEEWKGWMQLVILTYHFTGASKVLPIYFGVRLLVTSYLFLNGFGQFTFFFVKGNFGVMRILQTFIRLNLLVVLLCVVMSRPYQFYYFVPLVSFWFVVIYLTMCLWPQVTTSRIEGSPSKSRWYAALGVKLVVVTVVISILYIWEESFDGLFGNRLLAPLFRLDDSLHEWRFRWALDRYSVVCGMLFGLGYQYLKRHQLIEESPDTPLFSVGVTKVIAFASVLLLMAYSTGAFLCFDKFGWNAVYPYFGFSAVLSYVLLRNLYPSARSTYSYMFAWFGKISLELFISQYHIWLADDTKKILVLVPGYPVANVLLTSLIFVSVCNEIYAATSHFASYFTPRKPSKPPPLPTSG